MTARKAANLRTGVEDTGARRIRVEEASARRIRVGVGGWTYAPWRDNFFPAGLPHSQELHHASRHVSAIEVNGTYYTTQKPATFAKWHDEVPDDFVFSLKASRYATNRRVLAEAGDSIHRFVESGITELKAKLGPIVWQFMPTKQFDPHDFECFLALLPEAIDGHALRHVIDVRHPSFMCSDYLALARSYQVATVFADSDEFPSFADRTADFVYARLLKSEAAVATGYRPAALDAWAERARTWAAGGAPESLHRVEPKRAKAPGAPTDVFIYFINGAKERAPAGAMALLERLGWRAEEE